MGRRRAFDEQADVEAEQVVEVEQPGLALGAVGEAHPRGGHARLLGGGQVGEEHGVVGGQDDVERVGDREDRAVAVAQLGRDQHRGVVGGRVDRRQVQGQVQLQQPEQLAVAFVGGQSGHAPPTGWR
jgi:hypothetical protein